MVKKLKDDLIQEVLSGEVFAIRGTDKDAGWDPPINANLFTKNLSIEEFQSRVSKYSDACIQIESRIDDKFDTFLDITDEFKKLYSQESLSQKDEIVKFLKECKKYSKEFFKEKYKECINYAHDIALTENFIYDSENSDKPKTM